MYGRRYKISVIPLSLGRSIYHGALFVLRSAWSSFSVTVKEFSSDVGGSDVAA
jgi:hypothetical protein